MTVGRRARRSSLEQAIRASSTDLLSYLRRRVGDDAADALGETFAIAWRRADDAPAELEHLRMWLFGVARGVVRNHRRGERRRWALADRIRLNPALSNTAPAADEYAEVRDAIARLEPDLCELVQLVHWEGMTLVEAAQVMDIPASTARGRYQRAREQLRDALSEPERPATRCDLETPRIR